MWGTVCHSELVEESHFNAKNLAKARKKQKTPLEFSQKAIKTKQTSDEQSGVFLYKNSAYINKVAHAYAREKKFEKF